MFVRADLILRSLIGSKRFLHRTRCLSRPLSRGILGAVLIISHRHPGLSAVVREGFAAAIVPGNAHLHRLALTHLLAVLGFGPARFCFGSALFGFYGLPVGVIISGK